MTFADEELANRFDQMVESVVDMAGVVDVERALTEGRLAVHKRRTRAAVAGAGAIGTVAALVAISALVTGTKPAVVASSAAPALVDPLHSYAEFGWLPTSLPARAYSDPDGGGMAITSAYDPKTVGTSEVSTEVDLMTWPNGPAKMPTSSPGMAWSVAGSLNGRPVEMFSQATDPSTSSTAGGLATWPLCAMPYGNDGPPGPFTQEGVTSYGVVGIAWQTASGAVAEIDYHYVNQTPPDTATMMNMAETVTFAKKPLAMPFSVQGFAGTTVTYATQGDFHDPHPAASQVSFEKDGVQVTIYSDWPIEQSVGCGPYPPTGQFALRMIDGVKIYVILTPADPNAKLGSKIYALGTASQILNKVTWYGVNPANWTMNVIR